MGLHLPLGAFTVATIALAKAWRLSDLGRAAAGLFVLLVVFWPVVAVRTLWAQRTGELWQPRSVVTSGPIPDPGSRTTLGESHGETR